MSCRRGVGKLLFGRGHVQSPATAGEDRPRRALRAWSMTDVMNRVVIILFIPNLKVVLETVPYRRSFIEASGPMLRTTREC